MKYVVFDIETTGLDIFNDRIIEIGAIKVENDTIVDEFSTLINPGVSIPQVVSEINNITDDMLFDAPLPGEVLYKFNQFLIDVDFIVGHNAKRFDYPFLEMEFDRHFVKYKPQKITDTLHLSRRKIKGLRSYSLAALCRIYQIENKDAHRALSDVYATYSLYKKLQEEK